MDERSGEKDGTKSTYIEESTDGCNPTSVRLIIRVTKIVDCQVSAIPSTGSWWVVGTKGKLQGSILASG